MTGSQEPATAGDTGAFGLLGTVAQLLNSGRAADEVLAGVAEAVRSRLPADRVWLWVRESNATTVRAITAPGGVHAPRYSSFAGMPPAAPGILRRILYHEGEQIGMLELETIKSGLPGGSVLVVLGDVLAPYLGSLELSQDLASEVALRSREIEEQRQFVSLVVDCLPVGLYVVDREYRIQIWNRKRETGTQGLKRDEVVGRPVFEVLTRQPAEQLRSEFDQVFRTGEIQQMEIAVPIAGEERFFRISKIPMRQHHDGITHVITIGEDVTEYHHVHRQILQSEKLAAIGQLAAGVMHEINNPLATIGACVAAIGLRLEELKVEIPSTVTEYLDIIDKEVQRCTNIVDGLLDFSRPKESTKRPVDLTMLVEETLFLLKHHQRFKRLTLVRELSQELPRVRANAEQLIQAFMAIMLNSLDAMENGGSLTVRSKVNPGRGDEVVVEIEDTGVGIPRSDLPKIFEPFYTTKPPGRGTGLGLSVVYGIVEGHHGRIEVDSIPGKGTTFVVYLPVQGDPV
ncbi:MAG TPA: ATP-binding protein [Gemmatimonadales bacterium]|nr:ATP-binding protein [Gemmatimonadales bacterium]